MVCHLQHQILKIDRRIRWSSRKELGSHERGLEQGRSEAVFGEFEYELGLLEHGVQALEDLRGYYESLNKQLGLGSYRFVPALGAWRTEGCGQIQGA
eukprot:554588-Amorphochlora_amoeboformis.AAC.1